MDRLNRSLLRSSIKRTFGDTNKILIRSIIDLDKWPLQGNTVCNPPNTIAVDISSAIKY
jgi:hypothetical protein